MPITSAWYCIERAPHPRAAHLCNAITLCLAKKTPGFPEALRQLDARPFASSSNCTNMRYFYCPSPIVILWNGSYLMPPGQTHPAVFFLDSLYWDVAVFLRKEVGGRRKGQRRHKLLCHYYILYGSLIRIPGDSRGCAPCSCYCRAILFIYGNDIAGERARWASVCITWHTYYDIRNLLKYVRIFVTPGKIKDEGNVRLLLLCWFTSQANLLHCTRHHNTESGYKDERKKSEWNS